MQRLATIIISLSLTIAAASSLRAQAARVGRLPVLAPPPRTGGICRHEPTDDQLRSAGIVRMLSFSMEDGNRHRLQSIGVDSSGAVRMLMAMMGTRRERRGESESVTIFFGPNGTVLHGEHNAFTTGVPARASDDRKAGLLPTDTAQALTLARALRKRCGP